MSNLKLIKKQARGYKIGKAFYSKKNMTLAIIETNLIFNNLKNDIFYKNRA